MFRGTFEQKTDDKGRVNVPLKLREVLGPGSEEVRLVITNSRMAGKPCLDAYPYQAWADFERRLLAKTDLDPDHANFYLNYYVPSAQECPLDKQGRILLPTRLRDYAGLGKDLVFTGALNIFRIWAREAWQPVFESGERVAIDNPQLIPGFGI